MIVLSIDGRELTSLLIYDYKPKYELLDGEGTGRTKAPGWKMIRDPQGVICNFAIKIFETRTDNPDYMHFINTFYSLGSREFVNVTHRDPAGKVWNQNMYYVVDAIHFIEPYNDGFYVDEIAARFIAERGR